MGRVNCVDLRTYRGKQQLKPEHFDRTRGRASTAPDKSDKEDHRNGKTAPLHVIRAGITGARHDRRDIEKRLAQRLFGKAPL